MEKIGRDEYMDEFGVIFNERFTIIKDVVEEVRDRLEEYIIPDGVKEIGESAFEGCYNLQKIQIPDSVNIIGKEAFAGCWTLESLSIPDSVNVIEDYAFPNKICYLQISERFLDRLDNIFWDYPCIFERDLVNVKIIHITGKANRPVAFSLSGAPKLEEFIVDSTCAFHCCIDGILYSKDQKELIRCPSKMERWIVPTAVNIEKIHEHAFEGCKNLKRIWIPDSVTEIGDEAFVGCEKIKTFNIPNNVRGIGFNWFNGCKSLQKVYVNDNFEINCVKYNVLGSGVKEILPDKSCTSYCSVDGVLFNHNKTHLVAFPPGKKVFEYNIPDDVMFVDEDAFLNSSIEKVFIPQSIASIGDRFSLKTVREVIVDKDNPVFSSRDGVLFNKDQTKLLFYPDGRNLEEYTIPDTVDDISNYAFAQCSSLLNLNLYEQKKWLKDDVTKQLGSSRIRVAWYSKNEKGC